MIIQAIVQLLKEIGINYVDIQSHGPYYNIYFVYKKHNFIFVDKTTVWFNRVEYDLTHPNSLQQLEKAVTHATD